MDIIKIKRPVDVFKLATGVICGGLKSGITPWGPLAYNALNGKIYTKVNSLSLGIIAKRYTRPAFLTYEQVIGLGGEIKDINVSHAIVKPVSLFTHKDKVLSKSAREDLIRAGYEDDIKLFNAPYLSITQVYNIDEVRGIELIEDPLNAQTQTSSTFVLNQIKDLLQALDVNLREGPKLAYHPLDDVIEVPVKKTDFSDSYVNIINQISSLAYARCKFTQEINENPIVGEIARAITTNAICNALGLTDKALKIQDKATPWINALATNDKMIFLAARKGQCVIDYIDNHLNLDLNNNPQAILSVEQDDDESSRSQLLS